MISQFFLAFIVRRLRSRRFVSCATEISHVIGWLIEFNDSPVTVHVISATVLAANRLTDNWQKLTVNTDDYAHKHM